jgi:5'-3' exonuclease
MMCAIDYFKKQMTIKNLTKFLNEKYPEVFDRGVKLSEYAAKKIAIDTAIFMCKFKASNSETWLEGFISLVTWMRRENVHPVFVMDNGAPPEKAAEKKKRAEVRKKQENRAIALEEAVGAFHQHGGLDGLSEEHVALLKEVHQKEEKRGGHDVSARRRLLLLPVGLNQKDFDIGLVETKLERMKKHMFTVKSSDYDLLKKLLDVLKVPWINAQGEAEKECARMVIRGEAAAVLSEDSDCLAYKAPVFLCKPDFVSKTVRRIYFSNLIDTVNMTEEEFLDFCIMCGTDYNPNVRGIGVCKSFDLIQKCKSIEKLPEKIDSSVLNYQIGRKLFSIPPEGDAMTLPSLFTGVPLETEVRAFFFKHNIRTPAEPVIQAFKPSELSLTFKE